MRGLSPLLLLTLVVALSSITYGVGALIRQEPGASSVMDCEEYASSPNLFGYCIYQRVGSNANPMEVIDACFQAGTWEANCRHGWVSARLAEAEPPPSVLLLEVCGEDDDCRLDVVDREPAGDLVARLQRCAEIVRTKGSDCAAHAAQLWWWGGPDRAEIARVGESRHPYPELIGFYLGASVACPLAPDRDRSGPAVCPENPRVMSFCEVTARELALRPNRCPPRGS